MTSGNGLAKWARGVDQADLAKRFGTPLYVTSLAQLTKNAKDWFELTGNPRDIAWPVKANPSLSILRQLARLGCSVDCASESEIRSAIMVGIPWSGILYNTPVPNRDLLAQVVRKGGIGVVDSVEILQGLEQSLQDQEIDGQIFVRVSPRLPVEYLHHADWESSVAHASTSSKFGIPEESIVELLKGCQVPIKGLHMHVGTQMDHLDPFKRALELLHGLADEIHQNTSHRIEALDLGGGLGICFQESESFPTILEYVAAMKGSLRSDFRYLVEPGHALVGDTVALLTTVREVKEIRGRRWALVDAGTDQLAKVTLMNWYHEVLGPDGVPLPTDGSDAVGGPHCFAGDLLVPHTQLGSIRTGDTLLVQHVGAYCYALANHFNGRFGPSHVAISEDGQSVTKTHQEEDWFFDSGNIGFDWLDRTEPTSAPDQALVQQLPLDHVRNLSSQYLSQLANNDRYEIIAASRLASGRYFFEVQVQTDVEFISMPFAIRIVGDATIVATLDCMQKQSKDVCVWATRLAMRADSVIPAHRPLRVEVHISPPIDLHRSDRTRSIAHWSINEGQFSGSFYLSI
ncbi:MAG: diaminopimelate decarboxylase family protein [Pirellula sp.]